MTAILKCKTCARPTARQAARGRPPHLRGGEGPSTFVGPNGAGKTTTIRIVATLLRPNSGVVRVGGYRTDTERQDVRRLIGFIPDEFGLYGEMLVCEYLEFFAGCYGVVLEKREPMVADLLELVGWRTARRRRETTPRGMRNVSGGPRAGSRSGAYRRR